VRTPAGVPAATGRAGFGLAKIVERQLHSRSAVGEYYVVVLYLRQAEPFEGVADLEEGQHRGSTEGQSYTS